MLIGDININIVRTCFINNNYLVVLINYGFKSCSLELHFELDIPDQTILYLNFNGFIDEKKIGAGVLQTDITDHFFTVISIEVDKTNVAPHNTHKTLNYNKLNEILFKEVWLNIDDTTKC